MGEKKDITLPPMTDKTAREILKSLIDIIATVPLVDNVKTRDPSKALTANMGAFIQDEIDADRGNVSPYDPTDIYAVDSHVIYNNKLYKCKTAVTSPEDFDSSKWDAVNLKSNSDAITSLNTVEQLTPVVTMANIYSPDYTRLKKCGKLCTFSSDIQFRANGSGYIEAMTGLPVPLDSLYFMAITDDGLTFSLAIIDDNGRLRIRNPLGGSDKRYYIDVTYFTN